MHLSAREHLIVELVAQRGELTTAELAAALLLTRERARRELRALEQAALIHVQDSARDASSFTLTAAGTQAAAEWRATADHLPSRSR